MSFLESLKFAAAYWAHSPGVEATGRNAHFWFNTDYFFRGMVIVTQDTNYSTIGMVIDTQDTNYYIGGMVINTQDTN